MGRAKIAMEYIKKDGARKTTLERRKKGLKKKAQELATLCDIPLCVVIYEGPTSEPDTFPENRDQVRAIIDRYVSVPRDDKSKKRSLNLESMLESKKGKIEQRPGSHYPSWLPHLDDLCKEELLELETVLEHKLEAVEDRIKGFRATFGNYTDDVGGGFEYGMQFPMLDQMGGDGSWSTTGVSGGFEADYVCPNYDDDSNGMMMMMMGSNMYYDGPQSHGLFAENEAEFGGAYKFELPPERDGLNWYEQSCCKFEV